MNHLFTYGTLMHSDVWSKVVKGHYTSTELSLSHYRRICLRDRYYPGLIANPDSTVKGIIYHDISLSDLERLDDFEGEDYCRIPVKSVYSGTVFTYLYVGPMEEIIFSDWDFGTFCNDYLDHFINHYEHWADL